MTALPKRCWWVACSVLLSCLAQAVPLPKEWTFAIDGEMPRWRFSRVDWSGDGRLELQEEGEHGGWVVRATAERQGPGLSWLVMQDPRCGFRPLRVVQIAPGAYGICPVPHDGASASSSWWLGDSYETSGFSQLRTILQDGLLDGLRWSDMATQVPLLPGWRHDRWLVVDEPGLDNYPQLSETVLPWVLEGGHLVVTTRGRAGLGAELLALLERPTRELAAPAGVRATAYGAGWLVDWPRAAKATAADWVHLDLSLPVGFLRRTEYSGLQADALAAALAPPTQPAPRLPWGFVFGAFVALATMAGWRAQRWPKRQRWLAVAVTGVGAGAVLGLLVATNSRPNTAPTLVHRVVADSHETLARIDTAAIVRPSRASTVTYSGHSVRARTEGPRGLFAEYGRVRTVRLQPGDDARFTTHDTMLLPGTVEVVLSAGGTRLSGEVTNRLGSTLRGAWLLTGDKGLRLGDIQPVTTRNIAIGSVPAPVDRAQLFADLLGELAPANLAALAAVDYVRPDADEPVLLARLDPPLRGARLSGDLPAPAELSLIEIHAYSGLSGLARSLDHTTSELVGLPGLPRMRVERQYIPQQLPSNVRWAGFAQMVVPGQTPPSSGYVWRPTKGRLEAFGTAPPDDVFDPATYTDGVLTTLYPIAAPSTAAPGDQP